MKTLTLWVGSIVLCAQVTLDLERYNAMLEKAKPESKVTQNDLGLTFGNNAMNWRIYSEFVEIEHRVSLRIHDKKWHRQTLFELGQIVEHNLDELNQQGLEASIQKEAGSLVIFAKGKGSYTLILKQKLGLDSTLETDKPFAHFSWQAPSFPCNAGVLKSDNFNNVTADEAIVTKSVTDWQITVPPNTSSEFTFWKTDELQDNSPLQVWAANLVQIQPDQVSLKATFFIKPLLGWTDYIQLEVPEHFELVQSQVTLEQEAVPHLVNKQGNRLIMRLSKPQSDPIMVVVKLKSSEDPSGKLPFVRFNDPEWIRYSGAINTDHGALLSWKSQIQPVKDSTLKKLNRGNPIQQGFFFTFDPEEPPEYSLEWSQEPVLAATMKNLWIDVWWGQTGMVKVDLLGEIQNRGKPQLDIQCPEDAESFRWLANRRSIAIGQKQGVLKIPIPARDSESQIYGALTYQSQHLEGSWQLILPQFKLPISNVFLRVITPQEIVLTTEHEMGHKNYLEPPGNHFEDIPTGHNTWTFHWSSLKGNLDPITFQIKPKREKEGWL